MLLPWSIKIQNTYLSFKPGAMPAKLQNLTLEFSRKEWMALQTPYLANNLSE
jgi:hypothetical protein